jgi:hypothetical protein
VPEREDEWTSLMRLAVSGDDAAYHRLLKAMEPTLLFQKSKAKQTINDLGKCLI